MNGSPCSGPSWTSTPGGLSSRPPHRSERRPWTSWSTVREGGSQVSIGSAFSTCVACHLPIQNRPRTTRPPVSTRYSVSMQPVLYTYTRYYERRCVRVRRCRPPLVKDGCCVPSREMPRWSSMMSGPATKWLSMYSATAPCTMYVQIAACAVLLVRSHRRASVCDRSRGR